MISTRIEKLKFIVEEMQIAFHLSTLLTDQFAARTMARHILVRAENFIEHARSLRKPLNDAACDTREFHKTKETYASAFEEYFKVVRHKLGAHVQDVDFTERIELWHDIEVVKIEFFVEGALEIYQAIAPMNVQGYVSYISPSELTDAAVLDAIREFLLAIDSSNGIELGTDPLAVTRNNTLTVLNMTPIHSRAGQLALIHRWIAMQQGLLKALSAFPRIVRILKARTVTDVVSFADGLVTRPVAVGALQAMKGLDKLIVDSGQAALVIDNFVAVSKFQSELQTTRFIRDSIGAHLEGAPNCQLSSLLSALDNFQFDEGLDFYERMYAVFSKTCFDVHFLRMYVADGKRVFGVSASREPTVPYASNSVVTSSIPTAISDFDDELAYERNLAQWINGDEERQKDARQFFWQAFQIAEIVERIEEVESRGSGYSSTTHEFRKVHRFLQRKLSDKTPQDIFQGVVNLILSCRNGWPYPLAEILARYNCGEPSARHRLICHTLGEIGSSPHASVAKLLEQFCQSEFWQIRMDARLALFKMYIKKEGLVRLNNRGQVRVDYNIVLSSLLTPLLEQEQLICRLAFASIHKSRAIGSLSDPFQSNYVELQNEIEANCLQFLVDDDQKSKAGKLRQLLDIHDYVGVSLLVALDLKGGDNNPLHAILMDCCCEGSVGAAWHDQASRNLAICFLIKKEYHKAYEIAEDIANRNPDLLEPQIFAAEMLGETLGAESEATQRITKLRRAYALSDEYEQRLSAIEADIAIRSQTPAN